jgi:hypothetical protein
MASADEAGLHSDAERCLPPSLVTAHTADQLDIAQAASVVAGPSPAA